MAFRHGTAARAYIGGFDMSCYINSFGLDAETETAEVTTLCKTAKNYIPGLEDATINASGFFDGDTLVLDPTTFSFKLNSLRRTITVVTYLPQTDAQGGPGYFVEGELTSYSIETTTDDAGTIEFEMQSNSAQERSVTLHLASIAETTTNNSTSVDNTVGTTNGASAALQVLSVAGTSTPTITVKVQHSTDNSIWTDLITFGAKTAVGSEVQRVTGTVNRYVRAQWTITGTTPSFTFHVAFSRK